MLIAAHFVYNEFISISKFGGISMNVIVIAPKGKMGRLVIKAAAKTDAIKITGSIGPKGRDYIGMDSGIAAGIGEALGAPVYDNIESVIDNADVVIDFSNPEVSMNVFETALRHKKAVVCGTTGFSENDAERIREISKEIPVVFAANTSMVVNLMYKLLETAANVLGNLSDIEIIEMHDRFKADAPSGTSKEMGEIMAKAMGKHLNDIAVYGRHGEGMRIPDSIGYHSVRAGDIPSSHTVLFGLMGERLEITHHAYNFECFANGACKAALYVFEKEPGFYTMMDVLGLS